jgi:4-amino-4-deoxy-L-arabinose transferase-like glycosyltransferase
MRSREGLTLKKVVDQPFLVFILFCIALVIYKIPQLSLPYYWDEAWVYGKAARTLADQGVSLSPDSLHPELGRGHPLLFHALFAGFLQIAGNTIFNSHLLALFISILTCLVLFLMAKKFVSGWAGVFATGFVMIQPFFLAQSSMVLPEMTLSLFLLLSLKFYIEEKYILLWLPLAAALLVKESAIVMFGALCLVEFVLFLQSRNKNFLESVLRVFLILSASIPWLIFLFVQKKQLGYYFFPEHIGYLSFKAADIADKFSRCLTFLFLTGGKNIFSLLFIASIVYLLYRKKKAAWDKTTFVMVTFFSLFILFSCFNYFSDRYLLCLLFIVALLSAKFIFTAFESVWIRTGIFLAGVIAAIINLSTYRTNSDHNPGYVNAIKVFQEGISYMKNDMHRLDTFYVYFSLREAVTDHYPGYIREGERFINIRAHLEEDARYFVFSNVENEHEKEPAIKMHKLVPVKRFEMGQAWFEIWKKPY